VRYLGVRYLGVALVWAYRVTLGPFLAGQGQCKYHPSCSQYAIDAYREFGFCKGSVLAAWRLLRCNPWSRGGVDYARDQRVFTLRRRPAAGGSEGAP
jgi:putative membrane protein insertion efficiency factor